MRGLLILLDHGAPINHQKGAILSEALRYGNEEEILALLRHGATIWDHEGVTGTPGEVDMKTVCLDALYAGVLNVSPTKEAVEVVRYFQEKCRSSQMKEALEVALPECEVAHVRARM